MTYVVILKNRIIYKSKDLSKYGKKRNGLSFNGILAVMLNITFMFRKDFSKKFLKIKLISSNRPKN